MNTVMFFVNGRKEKKEKIMFSSYNRVYTVKQYGFSKAMFCTVYDIPLQFYKNNFKFDRKNNSMYRTNLTYDQLEEFARHYKRNEFGNWEVNTKTNLKN